MHYDHQPGSGESDDDSHSGYSQFRSGNQVSAKPKTTLLKCAYCGSSFDRTLTTAMPFCSEQCRSIDLGNWLDESYSLPYEGEGTPDRVEEDPDDEE